ncbi:RES family NAD+ phosphorylase [Listeria swaminathanii]|uniref:RES family NAD+ phosphorylase n=1 Tax=Listeria swaminathanii TaxID=2713501 RepID=A0ABU2ICB8_9LIST|nr:RES family NAD+ phosphorylase [Listeria swaminathanii]MDT0016377.1 RES family NAD+ phosphorylase [Listeria swaminathanii]MDT0021813.1 RES family NAD+ phosphorylase [Listeria swaminathanii]MDT0032777.1 RES family NAD+ phosphorylase [Listeria swaminathanii]MDT0051373.1 RES family NAD+ phosphorylase [Listeria swaminathanii]MDT0054138.1 RES family NAD+ phosphorylase [Listeria swaminathanii]
MICCDRCFNDIEIKSIIKGLDNRQENCPLCKESDVYVYNTEVNSELKVPFSDFLSIYSSYDEIKEVAPSFDQFSSLKEELTDTWNIFNLDKEKIIDLIKSICPEFSSENSDLFSKSVAVIEYTQQPYIADHSILKCNDWDDFVTEITTNIRFNIDLFNKTIFANVLTAFEQTLEINNTPNYFRGRIIDKLAYTIDEMGAPPNEKAGNGRANTKGIPCLYLADSKDTSAKEIRAGLHDKITIGMFSLNKKIKIIDLVNIDKVSPFSIGDAKAHYVNKNHLKRIGAELSKTLRNNSSDLEYLPTQYVADFIKSLGYDGIKFKSTLHPTGHNLAIFDVDSFLCKKVNSYKIDSLSVTFGGF